MAPSIPTITQTQPDLTDPGVHYDRLIAILENCVAEAKTQPLPLGRVFDQMQTASYDLICIMLCLPFLQPISLGPLSTIGGLNFAALGWQLMRGQPTPWIPDRISRSTLSERLWLMLLKTCLFIFKTLRRFTRPRLQHWVAGPSGKRLCGSLIIIAGLLMAIPLAGIPLNNTLPVLVTRLLQ